MTPTAGTDYPCGDASVPGRERFYTQVAGPLTYEAWLEGVRKGRTFVTNGPMLDFHINGKGIGDEVLLKKPGKVLLEGRVRFDLTRDDVGRLDVIVNGAPVKSFPRGTHPGEISFQLPYEFTSTSWVALRASGREDGTKRWVAILPFLWSRPRKPTPPPSTSRFKAPHRSRPSRRRRFWRASGWPSWNTWKRVLRRTRSNKLAAPPGTSDGVDLEPLRKNREALLQAIQGAKQYFTEMAR